MGHLARHCPLSHTDNCRRNRRGPGHHGVILRVHAHSVLGQQAEHQHLAPPWRFNTGGAAPPPRCSCTEGRERRLTFRQFVCVFRSVFEAPVKKNKQLLQACQTNVRRSWLAVLLVLQRLAAVAALHVQCRNSCHLTAGPAVCELNWPPHFGSLAKSGSSWFPSPLTIWVTLV